MNKNLTDREQQTVDFYNEHGQQWVATHTPSDKISFWEDEIKTFIQFQSHGKLLEIGSGAGLEAQLLMKNGYDYCGIDISTTLLAAARKRNPQATFIEASLYDLPFNTPTFDLFWASAVFLHLPKNRITEALVALTKVLKENAGGFISLKAGTGEAIDAPTGRLFSYYEIEEFTNILNTHNFTVQKSYERTHAKNLQRWLVFFVTYEPK